MAAIDKPELMRLQPVRVALWALLILLSATLALHDFNSYQVGAIY